MHTINIFHEQIAQAFKQTRTLVAAGALLTMAAQEASAACTYNIDNEWNTGFVANITIKNDTGAAVNNWNINWSYSTNRITSSWNVNLTGSNPYTATNIGWNGNIAAGQSVSFGFQGNKNGAAAERPTINGSVCSGTASSVSSKGASSSVSSSSSIRSSVTSSSVHSSIASSSRPSSSSLRSSSSSSIISTTPALVYALNSGGAKVNYNGVEYQADRFNTGGTVSTTTDNISNVAEDALFQSERYGTFGYAIPVTNSTYNVELHFAEIYHTTVGKRSFNVSVEDKQEMSQVDLYSLIGADAAYTYTVNNVQVTDGKLNIDLTSLTDNATLAGFAIYSSTGGKFIEPPVVDPVAASKENEGADCVLGNAPAVTSNAKLPDPFKKYNGSRIASKSEWRCQRQEILKQVESSIYGTKPPKPEKVTGTVSRTQITVNVEHQGKTASFTARVEMPTNATGAVPAVVVLGGFGGDTATIKAEGAAVITYDPYLVGAESGSRTNGNPP
jgi:hypothetical protein